MVCVISALMGTDLSQVEQRTQAFSAACTAHIKS
jgi:hypothetical protein